MKYEVTLPLRLHNPLNGSWGNHFAAAAKRKRVREPVKLALRAPLRELAEQLSAADITLRKTRAAGNVAQSRPVSDLTHVTVTMTRIAPSGGLDPHDGLRASCKPVVDGVADALGIDDRDVRVEWRYAQERGKPKQYAVRICVEAA